jgi:hypothetical protein
MLLLNEGASVNAALQEVRLKGSHSWVRKLKQRFAAQGISGLVDGRVKNARTLLPNEVRQLALTCYFRHRAAQPKALWEKVRLECAAANLPAPSYSWVKWFMENLPPGLKIARQKGIEEWVRQAAPTRCEMCGVIC